MSDLPTKMNFRVERTEYADIEVDVPGLIEEWGTEDDKIEDREDVIEVLCQIGALDLMYSGDFINVIERDNEESIR